ncbi:iron-sulfur cluster assembly scaffold protein [Pseudotabrizicola algicola]|uniref:Iron-sulfur cluster assembly scaffold protein n=1 Tax=Pseudotabrizicola algicola TaxID=2709381 RepID=A0A6B3RFX2_9RHOB|nr:iron-sulfur cluster assembly scaffold protein [Pseudotabrizicola algicola]NEX44867.1 iron-sulfur cluster assembly scaffold protein [Pseudotabrizicola algicola]
MSDSDLISLYSGRILELAADIPHHGRLPQPQATVRKRSPLCGSTVTVDVVMEAGRVTAFAQDVKACALGQAAASLLGQAVLGRTAAELAAGRDALRAMLKSSGPVPPAPFAGFEVLTPARDYKNRHASILLAIEAAAEAASSADAAQKNAGDA